MGEIMLSLAGLGLGALLLVVGVVLGIIILSLILVFTRVGRAVLVDTISSRILKIIFRDKPVKVKK